MDERKYLMKIPENQRIMIRRGIDIEEFERRRVLWIDEIGMKCLLMQVLMKENTFHQWIKHSRSLDQGNKGIKLSRRVIECLMKLDQYSIKSSNDENNRRRVDKIPEKQV